MIDLWTALERLLGLVSPLGLEEVPLAAAVGRIAARDVVAPAAVPGYRRAMMDGYVGHADDVDGAAKHAPVRLALTGAVRIGDLPIGAPARGEAWSITTGGLIPDNADTVIPMESSRRQGGDVIVERGQRMAHVAPPDDDVRGGEIVLRAGDQVTALTMPALAAVGATRVKVMRRPRVLVLSTGDEVVDEEPVDGLPAARVRNVNGPALLADLRALGFEPLVGGVVRDEPQLLRQALAAARQQQVDVVLSTGGVSIGPYDYVARCWRELGATPVLAGVDVKPGWPVFIGRHDDCWAVGLSGSPVACLTTYHLLIRPILLRLAGHQHVVRPIVPVVMSTAFPKPAEHTRLLWASVSGVSPPYHAAVSVSSGKLTGISHSNAIVIMPAGTGPLIGGERLWAVRLDQPEDRASLTLPGPDGPQVPAVCLVGRSDAGKTTAATGLIRRLAARGLEVLAIKHAAHGFGVDRPGSDSQRLSDAGAGATWVSGPGGMAMQQALPGDEVAASHLVRLAVATRVTAGGPSPDIVLLEGFSAAPLPRIQVGPPKGAAAAGSELVATLADDFGETELDNLAELLTARFVRSTPRAIRGAHRC